MSYVGRVLKYKDLTHDDRFVYVYVMWDELIDDSTAFHNMSIQIHVLTLEDVNHTIPSDRTWNWYYDPLKGLEPDLWEVVL